MGSDLPTVSEPVRQPDQRLAEHEQNMRDLKLIRDDPGWALTAVREWRRLAAELAAREQQLQDMRASWEACDKGRFQFKEQAEEAERQRDDLAEALTEAEAALTFMQSCMTEEVEARLTRLGCQWNDALAKVRAALSVSVPPQDTKEKPLHEPYDHGEYS